MNVTLKIPLVEMMSSVLILKARTRVQSVINPAVCVLDLVQTSVLHVHQSTTKTKKVEIAWVSTVIFCASNYYARYYPNIICARRVKVYVLEHENMVR